MDGCIDKLAGSLIHPSGLCDNPHILRLTVGRLHAAHRRKFKPSIGLNLCCHASQGIAMCLQKDTSLRTLSGRSGCCSLRAAEIRQNAAFYRKFCRNSQAVEFLQQILRHLSAVTGGTVYGQKVHRLLHNIIGIPAPFLHKKCLPSILCLICIAVKMKTPERLAHSISHKR